MIKLPQSTAFPEATYSRYKAEDGKRFYRVQYYVTLRAVSIMDQEPCEYLQAEGFESSYVAAPSAFLVKDTAAGTSVLVEAADVGEAVALTVTSLRAQYEEEQG